MYRDVCMCVAVAHHASPKPSIPRQVVRRARLTVTLRRPMQHTYIREWFSTSIWCTYIYLKKNTNEAYAVCIHIATRSSYTPRHLNRAKRMFRSYTRWAYSLYILNYLKKILDFGRVWLNTFKVILVENTMNAKTIFSNYFFFNLNKVLRV